MVAVFILFKVGAEVMLSPWMSFRLSVCPIFVTVAYLGNPWVDFLDIAHTSLSGVVDVLFGSYDL